MLMCYMLIGAPGTGKSTYSKQLKGTRISLDDLIEDYGRQHGLTYREAFDQVNVRQLENQAMQNLKDAVARKENVIIDFTNMTVKSRAKKLKYVPDDYKKVAITFNISDAEHRARIEQRKRTEDKEVPDFVIKRMLASYQAPTKDEFDQILRVN